jgi:hypothetical protein
MVETSADKGELNLRNPSAWISKSANDGQRVGYVTPVILPLNLLYLATLGCLLGSLSQLLAKRIGIVSGSRHWRFWLFPAAYIVFDIIEDTFIVLTLSKTITLSSCVFYFMRIATIAKFITVTASIAQGALLLAG